MISWLGTYTDTRVRFERTVDWEPTFFKDLIRGFAPVIAANDWVLAFMLV